MILLTVFDLKTVNPISTGLEPQPQSADNDQIQAFDHSAIAVVKPIHYNGGSEGCQIFIRGGLGWVSVKELAPEVVQMVEDSIKQEANYGYGN